MIRERTFNLLGEDQYTVHRTDMSRIWTDAKGRQTSLEYSTEVIQFVQYVLRDFVDALPALRSKHVRVAPQFSAFGARTNMLVLTSVGVPVGVVAVNIPHKGILHSEGVAVQLLDYMKQMRSFYGLRDVFGIATTYEEWRVFWLQDCDEAAKNTVVAGLGAEAPAKQPGLPGIPTWRRGESEKMDMVNAAPATPITERLVHAGPVIRWDDEQLVRTLMSVLVKMTASPSSGVPELVDHAREYIQVTEHSWCWTTLPPGFAVSTTSAMPRGDASSFLLLAYIGEGGFGRLWVAAAQDGALCVIKFGKDYTMWEPDAEASVWRDAWQLNARELGLVGRRALLLPYVWTCPRNGPSAADALQVHKATVRAIERMAASGWEHTDLTQPNDDRPKWEHVGLYYEEEELCAVLIDLGLVAKVSDKAGARAEAVARMRSALGL